MNKIYNTVQVHKTKKLPLYYADSTKQKSIL